MKDSTWVTLAAMGGIFGLAAMYDGSLALIAVGYLGGVLTGHSLKSPALDETTSDDPAHA